MSVFRRPLAGVATAASRGRAIPGSEPIARSSSDVPLIAAITDSRAVAHVIRRTVALAGHRSPRTLASGRHSELFRATQLKPLAAAGSKVAHTWRKYVR